MQRSELRPAVAYAVVTSPSYRPGDNPRHDAVRPGYVLDPTRTWTQEGQPRQGLRGPAAHVPVLYLPEGATMSVPEFLAPPPPHLPDWALDAVIAGRANVERLAVEVEKRRPVTGGRRARQALLDAYQRMLDWLGPLHFAFVPLHAVLDTWPGHARRTAADWAFESRMRSLRQEFSGRVDSQDALRLFADRGVAIDPSLLFEHEVVLTYGELFDAFGRQPRADAPSDATSDATSDEGDAPGA